MFAAVHRLVFITAYFHAWAPVLSTWEILELVVTSSKKIYIICKSQVADRTASHSSGVDVMERFLLMSWRY